MTSSITLIICLLSLTLGYAAQLKGKDQKLCPWTTFEELALQVSTLETLAESLAERALSSGYKSSDTKAKAGAKEHLEELNQNQRALVEEVDTQKTTYTSDGRLQELRERLTGKITGSLEAAESVIQDGEEKRAPLQAKSVGKPPVAAIPAAHPVHKDQPLQHRDQPLQSTSGLAPADVKRTAEAPLSQALGSITKAGDIALGTPISTLPVAEEIVGKVVPVVNNGTPVLVETLQFINNLVNMIPQTQQLISFAQSDSKATPPSQAQVAQPLLAQPVSPPARVDTTCLSTVCVGIPLGISTAAINATGGTSPRARTRRQLMVSFRLLTLRIITIKTMI